MTVAITQDDGDDNGRSEFTLPSIEGVEFVNYVNEEQLDDVMRLVGQDLSEPYSIFTYRYFLHRWPQLCILAVPTDDKGSDETNEGTRKHRRPIGCVVCKIDIGDGEDDGIVNVTTSDGAINATETGQPEMNNSNINEMQNKNNETQGNNNNNKVYTGYIGMLAVEQTHRRSGVGTALVQRAIHRMQQMKCQSIRLETEVTNKAAMTLYEDRLGFVREEILKKYYLNW
eukprot:CAMPEP_0172314104 /NCGR_PEP_ID=MMETSP1058-20130122/21680_1 /TAXON_ID=83371 /ORGANISM="Detonula confervacea, Strain CCMP 353" /LENGTH=227 /DNA_ID=CAMNT_0013027879 /DNA_START=52 /DNA_END=732 /DNA_ORIENTATION=-